MTRKQSLRKLISILLLLILVVSSFPLNPQVKAATSFETLKFDFGAAGVEAGYIGVSATEKYSSTKGYGFESTSAVENVTASGTGANADAVRFLSDVSNHVFSVSLPQGVYKITVTTGDVQSTSITAEGITQLFFLTGSNATDSFTIPVTDGKLNIYPSSGVGGVYSLSSLVIEQESTGTTTKPTIWVSGDSTVASYYNVSDDAARGWGQYLPYYVDTNVYDVRNISVSGVTSSDLKRSLFPTIEYYGKPGDILLLAIGINDYTSAYKANSSNPYATTQKTTYESNLKDLISRAKAKGVTVYLVKQQGELDDCSKYPVPTKKWFSEVIDSVASSENVGVIDMFTPWLQFCLEKTKKIAGDYYYNNVHPNKYGANILAQIVADELFPKSNPSGGTMPSVPNLTIDINNPSTIVYETEVSGGPVVNPHKGFVMQIDAPYQFESTYPRGIGGSANNEAWNVISICSGVFFWKDLNPEEDVYDWTKLDAILAACEKNGMTYGIRVVPYSTGAGSDDNYGLTHNFVPQWVYDKGATKDLATYKYKTPTTQIYVPHWQDEVYISCYKKFIAALAERYDNDPRVEYVEIRAFGNFGEWHTSQFIGNEMPDAETQKDMLKFYADHFKNTTVCAMSDVRGEVYDYAISLGIAKRNNGLIMEHNAEWDLVPAYKANLPTLADNHNQYKNMLNQDNTTYLKWTPERFRECIEIAHLSIYSLDLDSSMSYDIYKDNKDLVDEMVNRLGYNFTVTSAMSNGNKLEVAIENTGLASCFFNIDLCAEVTDMNGNKIASFGSPIRIEKASFHDGDVNVYTFEYNGTLKDGEVICLSMYEPDNSLAVGKGPTVKFDNKNTLPNNRLMLVPVTNYNPVPGGNTDPSVPSHTHDVTLVNEVPATCDKAGSKVYYICNCGMKFEDQSCAKEITDIVIPATGHTYSTTWTTNSTNHWHVCTKCGAKKDNVTHTWNYSAATEEHDKHCTICGYVAQAKLQHTHKGTLVSGKSATCTATGTKAYYTCTCGKYFEDSACTKEITNINTWKVIAATGHTYSTTWTSDEYAHWNVCTTCNKAVNNSASHTWNYGAATEEHDKHCTICGYVDQAQLNHVHNGTYVATKQATCTAEGNVEYYSCSCGKKFSDSACTKEITNVKTPVTEHNYYTSWSISSTNHWHECKNCKAKKDNVTHIWNYPEATEDHNKSCTICGYVAQLKLQHTHKGTLVNGKSATCTTDGTKSYYTCTCGKYFEDSSCTKEITDINTRKVIKATGHVPGAAATTTTAQICTVCKAELAPALGGSNNTSGGNTGNGGSTTTNPTPVVTPSPVVTPVTETGLAGFIERLYNVALNRQSEPAGKEYWINEVKFNNQTGSDVANGFLVSDEFLSKQMSNSDFLEVLYKTFFDRTSDAQGKAYWLDLMNNGYSKKDVINGFCNSTEWANLCLTYGIPSGSSAKPTIVIEPNEGTKAFVTRLYETCLGRAPEQAGFEFWTYRLANLEDRGYSAAEGFFFSDEFVSKKLDNSTFVTLLYRTILGREPDQAGLNHWLGLMNNGMSKKEILKGFGASNEWADICSGYGILK